jgi:hypothetical protein
MSIRFNHESNAWACHLMAQAGWCRFDYASNSAEERHVLLPAFEKGWHSNLRLSRQVLRYNWLNLFHQVNVLVQLSLFELLQRLDKVNI